MDNYYEGEFENESRKSKISKFSVEDQAKDVYDSIQDIVKNEKINIINNVVIPYTGQSTLKHDSYNHTFVRSNKVSENG